MMKIIAYRILFFVPIILGIVGIATPGIGPALGALALISSVIAYLLIMYLIRCPGCGKSPYFQRTRFRIEALNFNYTSPFINSRCSYCGHPLGPHRQASIDNGTF